MSGNFAIKGGGVWPLMANAILNFHFDFLNPSLMKHQNTESNPTLSSSGIQDERRSCAECLHLRMTNLVNLFA